MLAGTIVAGCGTSAPALSDASPPDALRIEEAAFSLLRGNSVLRSIAAEYPIEALGTDGTLVVWQVDDNSGDLLLRPVTADDAAIQSLPVGLEADAICLARITDDLYDLFLADGDGGLHHHWLHLGVEPSLQPVRTLHSNPDVTQCAVDAERVYFLTPPIGIAAYARDPETDPVMELVYASAPAGAGDIQATGFRLTGQQDELRLLIWDETGQAYELDPSHPQNLEEADASQSVVPIGNRTGRPVAAGVYSVVPAAQTEPVTSIGDAADDPAILISDSGAVWIVGTNKRQGLHVYDLEGQERHRIDRGRLNNVDALPLSGSSYLLAASNRTHRTIDLFRADIDADQIEFAAALPLDLNDPYGLCMGRLPDQTTMVVVGGTDGSIQIWSIDMESLNGRLLHQLDLDSQTEGCVYDPVSNRLYIGEEQTGIWAIDIDTWERRLFDGVQQRLLVADIEGMDIYRRGENSWLVVSSQGDNTYVVYSLSSAQEPVKFQITPNYAAGIDGVSETDGLAVSSRSMPGFPQGVLVVQDGRNRAPAAPQNFKIVDWRQIEDLLRPPG